MLFEQRLSRMFDSWGIFNGVRVCRHHESVNQASVFL